MIGGIPKKTRQKVDTGTKKRYGEIVEISPIQQKIHRAEQRDGKKYQSAHAIVFNVESDWRFSELY